MDDLKAKHKVENEALRQANTASQSEIQTLKVKLEKSQKEAAEYLADKNRFENTIVNKSAQLETVQQLSSNEKERREAETGELRRLLSHE